MKKLLITLFSFVLLLLVFPKEDIHAFYEFDIPEDLILYDVKYDQKSSITITGTMKEAEDLERFTIYMDEKEIHTFDAKEVSNNNGKFSFSFPFTVQKPVTAKFKVTLFLSKQLTSNGSNTSYRNQYTSFLKDVFLYSKANTFNVHKAAKEKSVTSIRKKYKELNPKFKGSPYTNNPKTNTNSIIAGSLKDLYIQDGVNMTNFYRYLSNLPSDVVADATYNSYAQYGAAYLDRLNPGRNITLNHTPSRLKGISETFYKKAYQGTSSSNLHWSSKVYNIENSVHAYMDDSDIQNISTVGHRIWIQNPYLKKTGFGQSFNFYSMYVVDNSRTDQFVEFDYITWPSEGPMPVQMFKNHTAWSVLLDKEYQVKDTKKLRVTLLNEKTNKTSVFSYKNQDKNGKYFNVSDFEFGFGNKTIIFRPTNINYKPGDNYRVTISGLSKNGKDTTITYRVNFFSL